MGTAPVIHSNKKSHNNKVKPSSQVINFAEFQIAKKEFRVSEKKLGTFKVRSQVEMIIVMYSDFLLPARYAVKVAFCPEI